MVTYTTGLATTAFAGLDAYNQERAKAAQEKAEKEAAAANAKTLAQTA